MMKFATILSLLISFTLNAQKTFYVNAKSGLNYRTKPRGKILGKLNHKATVKIIHKTDIEDFIKDGDHYISGNWVEIENNGKNVYIFDGFLASKKPVDDYKTIKYITTICDCIGQFNSNSYSKTSIQKIANSYMDEAGIIYPNYDFTPSKIDDIHKLDLNELVKAHEKLIQYLKSIKINSSYWKKRINDDITYLEKSFLVNKMILLAYKFPKKLNEYDVGKNAYKYRNALISGGEMMLKQWDTLIKTKRRGRYNVDAYDAEYLKKRNSDRKFEYARADLMRFGLWNNMIHPKRSDNKNDREEFLKLLFYHNCSCDN